MKKHKIIIIVLAVVLLIAAATATVLVVVNNPDNPDNPNKPDTPSGSLTRVDFGDKFGGKVNQWQQTLGTVARNIPTSASSEGCNERYPTYGSNIDFSDEEKDNILQENALIVASDTTYDSMDADGNFYLKGEATGKKLYKHVASEGMYYGNVSDDQPAVVERITVTATEQRNFVTGLYAAPGEVVKIEISEADLAAVGGSLTVVVGQVSHRNNVNNIWKEKSFVRMPVIATKFVVTAPTSYVGFHLGGPIFIYPTSANGETFTVTVSGAVKYAHYIHGQTTREQVEEMKTYSAPYYDYEVWDMGVRMSGASAYGNYDYDNLVAVGDLWEKIVRTSRQVPTSANATISVGYVYDCFVVQARRALSKADTRGSMRPRRGWLAHWTTRRLSPRARGATFTSTTTCTKATAWSLAKPTKSPTTQPRYSAICPTPTFPRHAPPMTKLSAATGTATPIRRVACVKPSPMRQTARNNAR